MKILTNAYFIVMVWGSIMLQGCTRDFLNTKPASDLVVPKTLSDLQLLLDDNSELNIAPVLGTVSSDNYYMSDESWESLFYQKTRDTYIWSDDIFDGTGDILDWNGLYRVVLYANIVLKKIEDIERSEINKDEWNNIKGTAFFLRAVAFFNLVREFAPMYDTTDANTDLGIPLRLSPDINAPSNRATLKETYDQIISDAKNAKRLLSETFPYSYRNRPCKLAAFALLARVFLSAGAYKNAGEYADSALRKYNRLIDYNKLDMNSSAPFEIDNEEVIYQVKIVNSDPTIGVRLLNGYSIDTNLFRSYSTNDLRKRLFFVKNGQFINFKGSYNGSARLSNALTTDEMFLIRAECNARSGKVDLAMKDLNGLLKTRWKNGAFEPYHPATSREALDIVLMERRKELVMRGLRWMDLKRLNKEGRNIVLYRTINNKVYTLPPNDPRYVLPIPPDVIELSGIQQNKR